MTGALRRLAALAAALAPDRSERLLQHVSEHGASAAALAAALARGGREERLAALSAALVEEEGSPPAQAPPAHPLLRRLAREERIAATREQGRLADGWSAARTGAPRSRAPELAPARGLPPGTARGTG